jgi:hypothetical protein
LELPFAPGINLCDQRENFSPQIPPVFFGPQISLIFAEGIFELMRMS